MGNPERLQVWGYWGLGFRGLGFTGLGIREALQ